MVFSKRAGAGSTQASGCGDANAEGGACFARGKLRILAGVCLMRACARSGACFARGKLRILAGVCLMRACARSGAFLAWVWRVCV